MSNTEYKVLRSVCARLYLPGYVVLDKYRFSTRRHGCQCLLMLGTGYNFFPTPLSSSAVVLVWCMEHTGQEA